MYNIYYTLHAHSLYNCADIWAHLCWTITAALLWEINGGIFAFTRILCQQFAVMKYMLVLIRSLFARLDFTFCCDCYNLTTLNNNQRLETRSLFPAWSFSLILCLTYRSRALLAFGPVWTSELGPEKISTLSLFFALLVHFTRALLLCICLTRWMGPYFLFLLTWMLEFLKARWLLCNVIARSWNIFENTSSPLQSAKLPVL